MQKLQALLVISLCVSLITAVPVSTSDKPVDLVVTTDGPTEKSSDIPTESTSEKNDSDDHVPQITSMHITSDIEDRFSKTVVKSKMKNPSSKAREATFFVVIPDQAYISGFIMEIAGRNYTAYVHEKEKAKQTYDAAVQSGIAAAHVSVSARDSNKFTVNTNVEPHGKVTFYLTYEELLDRKDGRYEQVININPNQLVDDLDVQVNINESQPLSFVQTPSWRSGNEISKESDDLKTNANIKIDKNTATVKFNPSNEKQKQIARGLGKEGGEGLQGQFVVQYDVQRDNTGGTLLIKDGHFVHFFAPAELTPLTKHVVFVLDTSGSMYDQKMEQLKQAMKNILNELNPKDFFNLVEFNSNVKVHNLDAIEESAYFPSRSDMWYYDEKQFELQDTSFPPAYPVTNSTITKANNAVQSMYATGGTNIYEALRVGIHLIKLRQNRVKNQNIQPLILFLTDGDPTVGRTAPSQIISGILEENIPKIPIISLSFGDGADKNFLRKISLNNYGFARHIYEDSDASLQLQNFYKLISSPLLHDVKFQYTNDTTSLTQTNFPILYKGREIVVAGKYTGDFGPAYAECFGIDGPIVLKPTIIKKSVGQLERLWAYMTVKKYLDEKEVSVNSTANSEKKALDLALKYKFVTPVTSLVVVKPDESIETDAQAADKVDDNVYAFHKLGGTGLRGKHFFSRNRVSASGLRGFAPQSAFPQPTLGSNSFYNPTTVYSGASLASLGAPGSPTAFAPVGAPGPAPAFALGSAAGGFAVPDAFDTSFADKMETSTSIHTTTTTIKPVELPAWYQDNLPWLKDIFLPDGRVQISGSRSYKLGFNETSPANQACTRLDSTEGRCTLINDCPALIPQLTNLKELKSHFCSIDNEFVGVCCVADDKSATEKSR